MNKVQIEHRALLAIDRVRKGASQEDDGIEFKRELPDDPQRTARQIAAMANASRGEPFLWLIGVDERAREFIPATGDLATWWPRVAAYFDGEAPDLVTTHAEQQLVLAFNPVSPPYVVRTPHVENERGIPEFEVPWREGARTRSARHSDLVRLLVPALRAPEIEVLSGEVKIGTANSPTGWSMSASLRLYVTPLSRDLVTLPIHRATLDVRVPRAASLLEGGYGASFSHVPGSLAEASNNSQLYCRGPGVAELHIGSTPDAAHALEATELLVTGILRPAPDGAPANFRVTLKRVPGTASDNLIWR